MLALLREAASSYETLEAFGAASRQRHLAALAADASGLFDRRDAEAAAWAGLQALAEGASTASPRGS